MLTLYFSGTGNSAYVARLFAAEMGGACHSVEDRADFSALLSAADSVAFVYPVYASRVPRILREFVEARRAELHGKGLVILCTQMGFSGDGARCFTDMLDRKSFRVLYAEHINMPNNINNFRVFPRTGDRRSARLISAARRRVGRICQNIRAGKVKKRGFNAFSRLLGLMQGAFALKIERLAADSVQIGGECTGCSLCVRRCPMRNLSLENGKAAAHGNCTECYRCINLCPEKAIRIYFQKKVQWQYRGVAQGQGGAPL